MWKKKENKIPLQKCVVIVWTNIRFLIKKIKKKKKKLFLATQNI